MSKTQAQSVTERRIAAHDRTMALIAERVELLTKEDPDASLATLEEARALAQACREG